MTTRPAAPWAIYDPSGNLAFLRLCETEQHAWHAYLGWPTYGEIQAKREAGWVARPVTVTPIPVVAGLRRHAEVVDE